MRSSPSGSVMNTKFLKHEQPTTHTMNTEDKPKRGRGRPRLYTDEQRKERAKERRKNNKNVTLQGGLVAQFHALKSKASEELGINLNNQQFMQLVLTHWKETHYMAGN